ncbi:hypothetical protein BJX61DRAFT_506492 [Aspergillus egyptiacus]|nr:hypothetical protein BJX61DRAFT_506492 [Aspergillus egyptiacus]
MARSDTDHPLHTYAKQASNIARILDNAGIPNVLFGWLALGLTGADIEPELPAAVSKPKYPTYLPNLY